MKSLYSSSVLFLAIALSSCGFGINSKPLTAASSSSSSVALEVSYSGTLEKADPATLQEGTHRLALDEGGYLYLQSDALNLDDYVGGQVKVTGVVRATIDGTAKIMQVSQVVLLSPPPAATGSTLPTDTGSVTTPTTPDTSNSVPSSHASVSVSVSSIAKSVAFVSSSSSSSSSSVSSSGAGQSASADVAAHAATMAKENMTGSNWTQKYCTSYIGFCFPVYKNWWFKSFGAGAATLWHVELSSVAITTVGDGPIVVNFMNGSLPDGISDSDVSAMGDTVTGYRSWTANRHFEISAPASLKEAVAFITRNLETYEPPQAP